jgi:Putative peptidoglycan binding domain
MNCLQISGLPILAASLLVTTSLSFATTETEASPAAHHASAHSSAHKLVRHASSKTRKHGPRGQQAIEGERAQQIQQALVREHYLTGQPSGKWDTASQDAMRRYQAAQGWQTKTVPDSRALIRLGLGPDHEHLLNPETAMTTEPDLPHQESSSAHISRIASPSRLSAQPSRGIGQQSAPAVNAVTAPAVHLTPSN